MLENFTVQMTCWEVSENCCINSVRQGNEVSLDLLPFIFVAKSIETFECIIRQGAEARKPLRVGIQAWQWQTSSNPTRKAAFSDTRNINFDSCSLWPDVANLSRLGAGSWQPSFTPVTKISAIMNHNEVIMFGSKGHLGQWPKGMHQFNNS